MSDQDDWDFAADDAKAEIRAAVGYLLKGATGAPELAREGEKLVEGCSCRILQPKLTHHQRQEAVARREAGESLVDIGRSYNVSHSTISRL
jgi:hypothetical protein